MNFRSRSHLTFKWPMRTIHVNSKQTTLCNSFRYLDRRSRQSFSCSTDSHSDTRTRLSKIWVPTGGLAISSVEDGHMKLVRAGFLRQPHAGIFHLLPLGCRVQEKLEALIDKYMRGLGASKLSLSSISTEELWSRTGRLEKSSSELFRFQDRKSTRYLLSPTHEEEITTLISNTIQSYKQLPVRVYQISRKYRDELRPRHGLFRSREFLMKDLYTFDYSPSSALSTYHLVRAAYSRLFDELKLSYLEAEADSGDIGGTLSHEFHLPTPRGEDHILTCSGCNYVANEEVAQSTIPERAHPTPNLANNQSPITTSRVWRGISKDRSTLINVWYESPNHTETTPASAEINFHAVKVAIPEFDSSVDDAVSVILKNIGSATQSCTEESPKKIQRIINLVDYRVPNSTLESIRAVDLKLPIFLPCLGEFKDKIDVQNMAQHPSTGNLLNLLRFQDGDPCPRCVSGSLKIHKTIELGHTFHLGTRYSEPLAASLSVPLDVIEREGMTIKEDLEPQTKASNTRNVLMEMGCHGIGVSRIIGAVADILADEKGLNWPRAIAPYEVIIIPGKNLEAGAVEVYDQLKMTANSEALDLVLDDRKQSFPWKMQDADLVGYPIIVVVGRRWKLEEVCEIQSRKLGIRKDVHIKDLKALVVSLLEML
ncbi:hypothetical protein K3495_g3922 [Podosphaera aphanis]|nr:hypothetical protein K3495_g3922 [Podosphaera aphanis]